MFTSLETLYLVILATTWFMCSRCSWRKLNLSKSPAINPETLTLHLGMFAAATMFLVGSYSDQHNFLPYLSVLVALSIFYATEANNESFWRKRRNLAFGGASFCLAVSFLQITGLHPLIISSFFLLSCVHKSQITLGHFYRYQIQDFQGVKEKLFFMESNLRNLDMMRPDERQESPELDKAV